MSIISNGFCTKNENGLFEINYGLERTFIDWLLGRKANEVVIEIKEDGSYYQISGRVFKAKHFNYAIYYAIVSLDLEDCKEHYIRLIVAGSKAKQKRSKASKDVIY